MEANADFLASLELAAQALVVAANITGFKLGDDENPRTIFTGQDTADKSAPCVVCEAGGEVTEDPPETGNYWTDLEIMLKWPAAVDVDGIDPKPLNDAAVQSVFNLFRSQTLPADLNALGIPNLTVMAVIERTPSFEDQGDVLVNTLKMRVYGCPATLPA